MISGNNNEIISNILDLIKFLNSNTNILFQNLSSTTSYCEPTNTELMQDYLDRVTNNLKYLNNNGYIVYIDDNLELSKIGYPLNKFNLNLNIMYFFLNINLEIISVDDFKYLISDLKSAEIKGNLILFYQIDFNDVINVINLVIKNNYENIFNVLETLDNLKTKLDELNSIVSNISKIKEIFLYEIDINCKKCVKLCSNNSIINNMYINNINNIKNYFRDNYLLSLILNNTNLIEDFKYYINIPNINYSMLPKYFKYEDILYFRENDILYMSKDSITYYRIKNKYYKIINKNKFKDSHKTFKFIYELFFSNSEIIKNLLNIKNTLNNIFDNKIIQYKNNQIYFYSINYKQKFLLEIIDIGYFYVITDNYIEMKDIWEIYYNPNQNSIFSKKLYKITKLFENLLIKLKNKIISG